MYNFEDTGKFKRGFKFDKGVKTQPASVVEYEIVEDEGFKDSFLKFQKYAQSVKGAMDRYNTILGLLKNEGLIRFRHLSGRNLTH
jgi:hypothetical protein